MMSGDKFICTYSTMAGFTVDREHVLDEVQSFNGKHFIVTDDFGEMWAVKKSEGKWIVPHSVHGEAVFEEKQEKEHSSDESMFELFIQNTPIKKGKVTLREMDMILSVVLPGVRCKEEFGKVCLTTKGMIIGFKDSKGTWQYPYFDFKTAYGLRVFEYLADCYEG